MPGERVDTVRDADEADLQELEQALNREQVRGGAGETRQVFDDNDVDLARLVRDQAHHPLVAWPIGSGAARSPIGKPALQSNRPGQAKCTTISNLPTLGRGCSTISSGST